MNISDISPCIIVEDVQPARDFYQTHLDARIVFDCGWYLNISFGNDCSMQFMQAQSPEHPRYAGGLTCNFQVDDVDAVHQRLADAGLTMIMSLEDHPWGDRGFATTDPYGVTIYIYTPIPPTAEYSQYYKD